MKKGLFFALAGVVVLLFSGSAFAANSLNNGAAGISVGMGDSVFSHPGIPMGNARINDVVDISGRYFVAKDSALYGGFGLQSDGGDYDAMYLSLTVGFRKYLKVDDFAPFVAGQFSFITIDGDAPVVDVDIMDIAGLFGAEYFIGKQFSLEGAVGIGLGQASIGNADDTYFGTRTVGIRANFYF